jgi:hypothetical protein
LNDELTMETADGPATKSAAHQHKSILPLNSLGCDASDRPPPLGDSAINFVNESREYVVEEDDVLPGWRSRL